MLKKFFVLLTAPILSMAGLVTNYAGISAIKAAASSTCPIMYLAEIPGTWESNIDPYRPLPRGMLDNVTSKLSSSLFKIVKVRYPARAFPYEDAVYGVSKQEGVETTEYLLEKELEKCPGTKLGILGFSQGADAGGDLAAKIGRGESNIKPEDINAVVLISDPRRSYKDHLVGPPVPGNGAGGARPGGFGYMQNKVVTICAKGDLYCSLPDTEYWGRIAGFIAENSGPIKDSVGDTTAELFSIVDSIVRYGGLARLIKETANNQFKKELNMYEHFNKAGAHTIYPNYYVNGKKVPEWVADYLTGVAES